MQTLFVGGADHFTWESHDGSHDGTHLPPASAQVSPPPFPMPPPFKHKHIDRMWPSPLIDVTCSCHCPVESQVPREFWKKRREARIGPSSITEDQGPSQSRCRHYATRSRALYVSGKRRPNFTNFDRAGHRNLSCAGSDKAQQGNVTRHTPASDRVIT
jgi:hypothetical protein